VIPANTRLLHLHQQRGTVHYVMFCAETASNPLIRLYVLGYECLLGLLLVVFFVVFQNQ